jgi:N-acetylglucosamine-6-sulfatase/beta-glucosidase
MSRLLSAACLMTLLGLLGPVSAEEPASNPAAKKVDLSKHARHKLFLKRNEDNKHQGDVIFLGDSITQGWEGQKAWKELAAFKPVNLGISGDRTGGVLWRITDGGEIKDLKPKAAVIMIGTNNLSGGHTPEQIAGGIKAIIDELKSSKPGIKVLLLGVFPRGSKAHAVGEAKAVPASKLNPGIAKINELIAKFDDGKTVFFKDIGKEFLDAEGGLPAAMMPDYLHLSARGYEAWARAIKGDLEKLVK